MKTYFIASREKGFIVVTDSKKLRTIRFTTFMDDETGLKIAEFRTNKKAKETLKKLNNKHLRVEPYKIVKSTLTPIER